MVEKQKKVVFKVASMDEAKLAARKLQETAVDAEVIRVKAECKVARIKADIQEDLQSYKKRIDELKGALLKWVKLNTEKFLEPRSVQCDRVTFGMRTCPPRVELTHPEEECIERARKFVLMEYVRVIREIDREKILADFRDGKIGEINLAAIGVNVVADEKAYVETDLAGLDVVNGDASARIIDSGNRKE